MTRILGSIGAGLLLAGLYTASPLSLVVLAGALLLCRLAGRGLPDAERRLLVTVLIVALALRAAAIAALFVWSIPNLNDLSVGALSGDEAYNLARALRARDLVMNLGGGHYDKFVVTDEYGQSSYLRVLTFLQWALGPTPFGAKLLNALLAVTGTALLFRVARPAFGPVPAFLGLVTLLAVPSLFYSSVTLLKESLYFLVTCVLLSACVGAARHRTLTRVTWAIAAGSASLWLLNDLRRGALPLAVAGLLCGLTVRLVAVRGWRIGVAAGGVLAVALVATAPPLRARALSALDAAARVHAGHVFTVGHAYKLLDEGFYLNPTDPTTAPPDLTPAQAGRFVLRGLASFIFTPRPSEVRSRGELAILPEHLLWCVAIALLPLGIAAGWARDPLVTALLVCYVLPTAVIVALTNGNVGTLLRLRGLVTPFWLWVSVLGLCQLVQWIAPVAGRPWPAWRHRHTEGTPA